MTANAVSAGNDVTVSLRLSRREARLIRPGLSHILTAHSEWERRGKPLGPTSPDGRKDGAEYSPADLTMIARVLEKTAVVSGETKRVHLDVFEVTAGLHGVRVTQTVVHHRHIEPWLRDHACSVRRLLTKLERIRRKARRAFIRARGSDAFGAASQQWQTCLRFVRSAFLSDIRKRPRLRSRWARRKALLEQWLELFRAELPGAGIEVPPEGELRDLVKRALSSGRRYIDYHGLMPAREHHDEFHERLWNFVADRCQKRKERSLFRSHGSKSKTQNQKRR